MGMDIGKKRFLRKLILWKKIMIVEYYRCPFCAERVDKGEFRIGKKRFLRKLLFWRKIRMVKDHRCPFCDERVDKSEFKNKVFVREFESSGLCQECQYTVFGYKVAW
jgi:hypothetical protein